MKKFMMSLGILCLIAGVIILGVFGLNGDLLGIKFGSGRYDLESADSVYTLNSAIFAQTQSIEVNSDKLAVFLSIDESQETPVVNYNSEYVSLSSEAEVTDGILDLSCFDVLKKETLADKFSAEGSKLFIEIILPAATLDNTMFQSLHVTTSDGKIEIKNASVGELKLTINRGEVDLSNVTVTNAAKIVTTTGKAKISNVTAYDLSTVLTTGYAQIDGLNVTGNVTVTTTTGLISVKNAEASSFKISSATGKLDCENITASSVVLETTTGAIGFDITADIIDVRFVTGSVNGKVHGNEEEYTVDIEKGVGSCNIAEKIGTSDKKLTLKGTTGAIYVLFV